MKLLFQVPLRSVNSTERPGSLLERLGPWRSSGSHVIDNITQMLVMSGSSS